MNPATTKLRALAALACSGALAAPLAAQRPACADTLRIEEGLAWETATLITADLTLDGAADAAYWRVDGDRVVVLVGTCDGAAVDRRWRFRFELPEDCPSAEARVEAASLLLDAAALARTCDDDPPSSECIHLRRENERRQALMDAGGRALRIGGPACPVTTLRWSPDLGGFMRVPG